MATPANFLTGVIEGFYGQPWTQAERFELFDWMANWGLNTYLYAPKDDLHHRAAWREPYPAAEAETLRQLVQGCRQRNLRFIYALSPGLDIRYSHEAELDHLKKRFEQMVSLGCRHFSIFFDDIPDRLNADDLQRFGSLASAQCHVANALFMWTRERCAEARFLFCPTAYCSRMAAAQLGGKDYLSVIGRELLPEIDVFWTGPEIISQKITIAHIQELQTVLRRKPLIWDNLHANDYDGRRFFCGPYSGRDAEIQGAVSGLLCNPNTEFPLNFVPLRTLAEFVKSEGTWDARESYLAAMREWLPCFSSTGQPLAMEDVILFCDCHYLPHKEGLEAAALYERTRVLLTTDPAEWGEDQVSGFRKSASRLHDVCIRMADLRHRPLFYALSRRIWELREEMDLLLQYTAAKAGTGRTSAPSLTSHLPGTYRGGMVAKLQRLLDQQPNGTFAPAHPGAGPSPDATGHRTPACS